MSFWPTIAASKGAKFSKLSPEWTRPGTDQQEVASVHAGDSGLKSSSVAVKMSSDDDLLMSSSGTKLLSRTTIVSAKPNGKVTGVILCEC